MAIPAAEVTACCSAIPTSNARSGNRSANGSRPVLSGIAAVNATSSGTRSPALTKASANASVYLPRGGAVEDAAADTADFAPLLNGPVSCICLTESFSAGAYPRPF